MIRRLDIKIVAIILVTVLVPLGVSLFLVRKTIDTSLGLGLNDDLAAELQQAVKIHRKYIKELKDGFRYCFARIVDSHRFRQAAVFGDKAAVASVLGELVAENRHLVKVRLIDDEGGIVEVDGSRDDAGEVRVVSLREPVALGPYVEIEALFEVPKSVETDYRAAAAMTDTYQTLVGAPASYLKNRFVLVYVAILSVAVLLTTLGGILLARRLVIRIHELGNATSLVAKGDLSVRVDPGTEDEVGQLVESFNAMVSELSVNRARIEYLQKISAWQEMARRLAHEIKNPLTPIQLAAQQLKEKYRGEDPAFGSLLAQSIEIISEEVETLRRLTSDFAAFAKLPTVRPEEVNLSEFLADCEASLAPVSAQRGVDMVFEPVDETIRVMVDRIMMKRVIDNLVRNATDAIADGGTSAPMIVVKTARQKKFKNLEVEIRVEDNGPGVSPEHHPSIFDPYFTTKSEGTGLGLAISKKIVLEHGGRIWLDEETSSGAAFVVVLPALS